MPARFVRSLLVGALAALAAAACASGSGASLDDTAWRLVEEAGAGAPDSPGAFAGFTAEGTVAGTTGCNTFTGPYEVDGTAIEIGPLATTRALCPSEALAARETALLAGLEAATGWSIDGDVLTLSDNGGPLVVFDRYEPTLEGDWSVTGYNTGTEAVTSLLDGTTITLAFGQDGTVSGSGGCNDFSGSYEAGDGDLTIGALAVTGRACLEDGVMEQESQFLAALEASESWTVFGATLTLRDGSGATQVTAVPAS